MPVLPLTTVQRMKGYGDIQSQVWTPANELLMSDMINATSLQFEQYCSRGFLITERTQSRRINNIFLPCNSYPVVSITAVYVSPTGNSRDYQEVDASQYDISEDASGINVFGIRRGQLVKYVYTGGIAENTNDIIVNHPSLENACRLQTLSLWKRRTSPDRSAMTLGTGDTQWTAEYGLLKDVELTLRQGYLSQAFM